MAAAAAWIFLREAAFAIRTRQPPCYSRFRYRVDEVMHRRHGACRGCGQGSPSVELDRSSNNVAYFCSEENCPRLFENVRTIWSGEGFMDKPTGSPQFYLASSVTEKTLVANSEERLLS